MREILFRGKRVDNNQLVYGSLDCRPGGKFYIICYKNIYNGTICTKEYRVKPDSVEQYTGLTDKNGKKIFAGDILEIYYDDICAAFKCRHYDENKKLFSSGFLIFNDSRADENILEVIGNIHTCPELLECENEHLEDLEMW